MHRTLTGHGRVLRRATLTAGAVLLATAAGASAAVTLEVDPATGLDPAGQSVAVTGAGVPLDTGTPMGPAGFAGLYAAQLAIVDGAYLANQAGAKYLRRSGPDASQKLEDDGTFATTVDVAATFTAGETTVDCSAAGTECLIASWPAHGNPTADNLLASVPIAFGRDVTVERAKLRRSGTLSFVVDQAGTAKVRVQRRAGKRWRTVDRATIEVAQAGRVRDRVTLDGRGRFRATVSFVAEDGSRATTSVQVRRR